MRKNWKIQNSCRVEKEKTIMQEFLGSQTALNSQTAKKNLNQISNTPKSFIYV